MKKKYLGRRIKWNYPNQTPLFIYTMTYKDDNAIAIKCIAIAKVLYSIIYTDQPTQHYYGSEMEVFDKWNYSYLADENDEYTYKL